VRVQREMVRDGDSEGMTRTREAAKAREMARESEKGHRERCR